MIAGPATSETVPSLSRSSHGSQVLCTEIMCAYRDAWGTAPGSKLLRALECFEEQTEVWHGDLELGD
jgi:hypothetical protein